MLGKVIQAVQTLTIELRVQIRSLAGWEPKGKVMLQICKHIFSVGSRSAKLLVCMRNSFVNVCTACITLPDTWVS